MLAHPTLDRLNAMGLAGMAKARKVQVVRGVGTFLDPHHLEVEETSGDGKDTTGKTTVIRFDQAIIAAGSGNVDMSFIMALQMLRFIIVLMTGPWLARQVARMVKTPD